MSPWLTVWRAALGRAAPYARNPEAQSILILVAAIAGAYLGLPRTDAIVAAGALLIGLAAGYWPSWRRRPRPQASSKLRRTALVEGVSAGSFKLAPGLPALAIPEIAHDIHSSNTWVDAGIAVVSLVGFATIWWSIRALRRNTQRPLRRGHVVLSFVMVGVGLLGFAFATNGVWLVAALAVTGLPIATNSRFRNVIQANYDAQESGVFQDITNRWSRTVSALGLPVCGALITLTPLGWRGVSLLVAGWFGLLGVFVVLIRRMPTQEEQSATAVTPPNLSKLWSVRRQVLLTISTNATAQLARTTLGPLLTGHHVAQTPLVTAGIFFVGQVWTAPIVGRYARRASRSPRQVALRATTLLVPAALLGWVTALAPVASLTIGLAAAWFVYSELGQIASGSAMRIGMNRPGQVSSLYGTQSGYIGQAVGSLLAAVAISRTPAGLATMLVAGALVSVVVAAIAPREVADTAKTIGGTLTITIEESGRGLVKLTLDDGVPPWSILRLADGDRIRASVEYRDRTGTETLRAGGISVWVGGPWWVFSALALVRRTEGCLREGMPVPFIEDNRFHGLMTWRLAGATYRVEHVRGAVRLTLRLPEATTMTWTHLTWRDVSDMPELVA